MIRSLCFLGRDNVWIAFGPGEDLTREMFIRTRFSPNREPPVHPIGRLRVRWPDGTDCTYQEPYIRKDHSQERMFPS